MLREAMTGEYEVLGEPAAADCIIAQAFGERVNKPGPVNCRLACYIIEHTDPNLPLVAQQPIAEALAAGNRETQLVIAGNRGIGIFSDEYLDSWGVLQQAHSYMREWDLRRPLLVAQAHHVGRVTRQAVKQGLRPIVPPDLPADFDPQSMQVWTRDVRLWFVHELVGGLGLKIFRKL